MQFDLVQIILIGLMSVTITLLIFGLIFYFFQIPLYIYVWVLGLEFPKNRVDVEYNCPIAMSDGITLYCDIYRPKNKTKYPVIILRTPYGKGSIEDDYRIIAFIFCSQGYGVIIQDVRGKYSSEGQFHPFIQEERDGKETVEWAAAQQWCNGKVALWGFSYLGSCAWLTAPNSPSALKTIIPMFCCQNAYMGWIDKGVPYLKDILMWLSKYHGHKGGLVSDEEVENIILHLPILEFDKRLKNGIETFKTWMYHLLPDEYWLSFSVSQRRETIEIPCLILGGWYDRFIDNTLDDFIQMTSANPNSFVSHSRLIIGPWGHRPTEQFPGVQFGSTASFRSEFKEMIRWLNFWMEDKTHEFVDVKNRIRYFMMGKNEWYTASTWPPVEAKDTLYFLFSEGHSNGFYGDGKILSDLPPITCRAYYDYSPQKPTPTMGNRMLYGNQTDGPREQTKLYNQTDILFFHSDPLKDSIEVAGMIKAILYVSSSAVDTDFAVKLCDLHPDGKAYYLVNRLIRMRFLEEMKTYGIEKDHIYRVEIAVGNTAHTFLKGHQLQVQISSADFPNYERNLNTGGSNEGSLLELTAHQTLYMGKDYPSQIILPQLKTTITI